MSTPNAKKPLRGQHAGIPNMPALTGGKGEGNAMKKRFFTICCSHMKIPCQGERLKILSLISE